MRLGTLFRSVREVHEAGVRFPADVGDRGGEPGATGDSGARRVERMGDGMNLMGCYFRRLLRVLAAATHSDSGRPQVYDLFFAVQNFASHSLATPRPRTFVKYGWLDFEDFCAAVMDVQDRTVVYFVSEPGHTDAERHMRALGALALAASPVVEPLILQTADGELPRPVGVISIVAGHPDAPAPSLPELASDGVGTYCDVLVLGTTRSIRGYWRGMRERGFTLRHPQLIEAPGPAPEGALNLGHVVIKPA